jgi:hypothetical protein
MTTRSVTTGISLVVAAVLLCIMGVWGYRAATAPIEGDTTTSSPGPTCAPQDQTVEQYVARGDVTVSVYNSGERAGRAQATMDLLERAGFRPGEVNNAPDGISVARASVYTTKADDPAAELVAAALGHDTPVVHSDAEFSGPGVDVVIGDKFKRLDPDAPNRMKLPEPRTSCG